MVSHRRRLTRLHSLCLLLSLAGPIAAVSTTQGGGIRRPTAGVCFQSSLRRRHPNPRSTRRPKCHRVSCLAAIPLPESSTLSGVDSTTTILSRFVAPTISSFATYFALAAAFDRPQGKIALDDGVLVARPSQVSGAGLGLYTTQFLPEDTVLGTYPGVVRQASAYLGKYKRYPQCGSYAWRFTDNEFYIDPTDAKGNIGDLCYGGSELVPGSIFIHENILRGSAVSTLLARVNEPPIGGPGCNVFCRQDRDTRQVTFSTSRDVPAGEELFMDYGTTYDRTGYGGSMSS